MSWEDRMAARAAGREATRRAIEAIAAAEERDRYEQEQAELHRAEFEAGPPDGCGICYQWSSSPVFGPGWIHTVSTNDDQICRHDCHTEPVWCGPVAYAGAST